MLFRKELEVNITDEEEFKILIKWCKNKTEDVEKILYIYQKDPKARISCPFPIVCQKFPCKDLTCNADVLDNGYAYRMS